jgi:uncharacterized glyoxalase superfamily protein PhnB
MNDATVFPTLNYDDAPAALDFLVRAFGGRRHAVYSGEDGTIHHAEVSFGNGIVMFGSSRAELAATRGQGGGIYIVVADPDAHAERARAEGAEIVRAPFDTDYGSRDYGARDPEGNTWHFGTYQPFDFDHAAEQAKRAVTS